MCPVGYEAIILSEQWITKNNFTYLYRIQRCEKLPTGPIHPLFYIIGGICLVVWIVLMCVLCWCCRGEQVAPCPNPPATLHLTSDPSLGLSPSPSQQDLGLSQREHRTADVGP